MKPPLSSYVALVEKTDEEVLKIVRGRQGEKGVAGQKGESGKDGERGLRGFKGEPGKDGKDGIDAVQGSPDTPDEVVTKVNKAKKKIKKSSIEGFDDIESMAKSANDKVRKYLLMGGSTLVKLQSNGVALGDFSTLNFTNGTVTNTGGTANYVSTGGGGSGYQAPLSGGLTGTNTWTTAPNVIVIDGVPRQKVQTDGSVMWTGTTTTVLTGAPLPTFDIFSSA